MKFSGIYFLLLSSCSHEAREGRGLLAAQQAAILYLRP